jgi:Outer membrane protein beta-barrel domain
MGISLRALKSKICFIFIPIGFSTLLSFFGCSDKYIQKDAGTKKEYYSKINQTIKDEVTKLYKRQNGEIDVRDAYIDSNSIKWPSFSYDSSHFFIPLSQVKKIKYENYQSFNPLKFSGNILLTNDSTLHIYDAGILNDTIDYYTVTKKPIIGSESISKLFSISCNDRNVGFWKFTLGGMFFGSMIGYELGANASTRDRDPQLGAMVGGFFFGVGGLIFGCLAGSPVEFSLEDGHQFYTQNLIDHLGIMGGISKSLLYGSFSDNRGYTTDPRVNYSFGLYYEQNISGYLFLRPEVVYSILGGNYNYNLPTSENYFGEGQVSVIYLHTINIPFLLELRPPDSFQYYLELFAGPCINVPLSSRVEEYQNLPMDEGFETSSEKLNIKPHISMEYGIGFKWSANFSTELYYNQVLNSYGAATLHDETHLDLRQFGYFLYAVISL